MATSVNGSHVRILTHIPWLVRLPGVLYGVPIVLRETWSICVGRSVSRGALGKVQRFEYVCGSYGECGVCGLFGVLTAEYVRLFATFLGLWLAP
jgi:hypothetical protein